jgi:hypothetical protein
MPVFNSVDEQVQALLFIGSLYQLQQFLNRVVCLLVHTNKGSWTTEDVPVTIVRI